MVFTLEFTLEKYVVWLQLLSPGFIVIASRRLPAEREAFQSVVLVEGSLVGLYLHQQVYCCQYLSFLHIIAVSCVSK